MGLQGSKFDVTVSRLSGYTGAFRLPGLFGFLAAGTVRGSGCSVSIPKLTRLRERSPFDETIMVQLAKGTKSLWVIG